MSERGLEEEQFGASETFEGENRIQREKKLKRERERGRSEKEF